MPFIIKEWAPKAKPAVKGSGAVVGDVPAVQLAAGAISDQVASGVVPPPAKKQRPAQP